MPPLLPLWIAATLAGADALPDCNPAAAASTSAPREAVISLGAERSYFLKDAADAPGCPAADARCHRRSYLVSGDRVRVLHTAEALACVAYTAAGGRTTVAWLDAASLVDAAPGRARDWAGDWRLEREHSAGNEADLHIDADGESALRLRGDATWGGDDPQRVANGGINIGVIDETRVELHSAVLRFVAGVGNAPPAAEPSFACVIVLQRDGDELRLRDNRQCGGMNVSFSGRYYRTGAAAP